jgi:hypothetical protein
MQAVTHLDATDKMDQFETQENEEQNTENNFENEFMNNLETPVKQIIDSVNENKEDEEVRIMNTKDDQELRDLSMDFPKSPSIEEKGGKFIFNFSYKIVNRFIHILFLELYIEDEHQLITDEKDESAAKK